MSRRDAPPFRADHVGSLLRPKELLDARQRFAAGTLSVEELRAAEDAAIRDAVALQEGLGLHCVTDGEFRRTYFHVDFLERLAGVTTGEGVAMRFRRADGNLDYAPPVLHVKGRVRHVAPIQLADFAFLRSVTTRLPKVTLPSPTMLHFRGGRAAISETAYPELETFYADAAEAYRAELSALSRAGCRYVQLDDTNLAYLCDEGMREMARGRGDDPGELVRRYTDLINGAIAGRPHDMIACLHMCRGNFRSAWVAEGGYAPVAEFLFNELAVDGIFLEYDDVRSGDFSPLRFVPPNKRIVLGLVTSKVGVMESKDHLKRRIDAAARYVPMEQLCLSPQCGFSSTAHGNDISYEFQCSKLRLVVETAREMWGDL
jgi:5-methyltetrahydropteroyltriglutamate--homocysteine methyltransferase